MFNRVRGAAPLIFSGAGLGSLSLDGMFEIASSEDRGINSRLLSLLGYNSAAEKYSKLPPIFFRDENENDITGVFRNECLTRVSKYCLPPIIYE